jgi:hypothetical protein
MSGYAAVLSTTPYQIPEHTSLLQKPFTIAELTVLVKRMLAKE